MPPEWASSVATVPDGPGGIPAVHVMRTGCASSIRAVRTIANRETTMKRLSVLVAAAAIAFAPAAFAETTFEEADQNGDGFLTPQEVAAVHPDATQVEFEAADADNDGALSQEEYQASTFAQS